MTTNNIYTFIKDPLPVGFDLDYVLSTIKKTVPEHLVYGLESIYIGQFDELKEKDMDAVYKDGAIYISPDQDNEADLLDDIIHEIAHSLEREHQNLIYGDGNLEREFLGKRKI